MSAAYFVNMDKVIEVSHVSKHYGKVEALHDVSFSVHKGEVFGLIGPDGAGKTTLFRILATLLLPAAGRVSVDGYDVIAGMKDIRKRVGYMPDAFRSIKTFLWKRI